MEKPTPGLEAKPDLNGSSDEISAQYETPAPEPFISFNALKDRIRHHYEICSDYYYSLWYISNSPPLPTIREHHVLNNNRGEHIHHGYFLEPTDTKEEAQIQLIELLLERSKLPTGSTVLDVGCGIGGTSRYLAKEHRSHVTGVTISGRQVEIAKKLSAEVAGAIVSEKDGPTKLGDGSVRFLELDAEKMGDFFTAEPNKATFDCVWISEAMSHLPNKELFFRNATLLLNPGGKLVVADWFKNEGLTEKQMDADIKPIEGTAPFSFSTGIF